MKLKLAILGASYLQKPLFEKAVEMGIETHCFAWEEGAVCKDICDYFYPISVLDKEAILKACKEINIDGITTIATDICIPTIAFVCKKMNLISNSFESAIKSTDKGEMRNAFKINKLPSPKFNVLSSFENEILKQYNFPVIIKPVDRSGSRGITKVADIKQAAAAFENSITLSLKGEVIIEEFIEGVEVSVESISWNGEHTILAITDKVTTSAPHFVELEHHQPSSLSRKLQDEIRNTTIKALNALDIKYGASHAEFKITAAGQIFIIEVGARMGGDFIGSHLVELSTGFDYLKSVIYVALGKFKAPKISEENSSFAGVYFLSEETKRVLPFFKGEYKFIVDKKVLNDKLKSIKNSNDRSGYIIYKGSTKIIL